MHLSRRGINWDVCKEEIRSVRDVEWVTRDSSPALQMREVLMQNYAPGKDVGMAHPPHPPSRPKINNLPAKSNYTKFTHTHTNRDLERVDINVLAKFARRRMQLWEWERKRRGRVYEYLFAGFINYWCSSPRGNLRPNLFAFAGSLAASVSLAVPLFGAVKRGGNLRRRERDMLGGLFCKGFPLLGGNLHVSRFDCVRFALINISTGNFSRDCIASIIEALLCS